MNKSLKVGLVLSLGVLSANVALANDAVVGALLGGGAGVLVGSSVGGRDGAVVGAAIGAAAGAVLASQGDYGHVTRVHSTGYYAPAYGPAYVAPRAYYGEPVYYRAPVRVVAPPVYYIDRGYSRGEWRRHHDRDWDRRGHRDHDRRDGRR